MKALLVSLSANHLAHILRVIGCLAWSFDQSTENELLGLLLQAAKKVK